MSDIRDRVADSLYSDVLRAVDDLWATPEFVAMGSEIERAMAANFVLRGRFNASDMFRIGYPENPFHGYFISPQHVIDRYRVDFLFGFGKRPELENCVVIECDGHDFHDRTPEQAARDKSRDRDLHGHVMAVLRFTGREIYRDPSGCWIEALNVLGRDMGGVK